MKDDLRNIINLEGLKIAVNPLNATDKLPERNTLVKLIPIEYLERGVKVLIDGKLFIAFIDGRIPVKEEIIAVVTNANPFSLSLKVDNSININNEVLVDQILKKFDLPNKELLRNSILKVLEEGHVLIKSNIMILENLRKYIRVDGLELSLLINLVWGTHKKSRFLIEDLYENLFDEKFETICNKFFQTIRNLMFNDIPQYLRQQINTDLIYDELDKDNSALICKSKSIYTLIRSLNTYNMENQGDTDSSIHDCIAYGTKYILQKSIFKEYDYYPDFVIIKHKNELSIVHYSFKKLIDKNNQVSYKLLFKHDKLPFELSGIVRNNLLLGEMNFDESLTSSSQIHSFHKNLLDKWGFNSDLKINEENKAKFIVTKINSVLNKLVS